jgi:pilus assembly protein CpaE
MPRTGVQAGPDHWKLSIICPHSGMSRQIRSALSELGFEAVNQIAEYPRLGAVAALLAEQECNLCFLDVASNQEHALRLISETASAVPVVALNPHNDADLILRCLRRGACEFLSEPTAEQVNAVLERLSRLHKPQAQAKPGIVYCVLPGKAGCGASTLATHLAVELKRSGIARVLLVDTDCLTGSIAFQLKLKPDYHLGDAVRDCRRLDEDLWSRLAKPCQGIDVLTAPENAATPVALDRPAVMELIGFWRERGPCTQRGGRFECLDHSGVDRGRLKLLVTRYTPATGLKREDVETALKLAPFALLSNDYEAVQNALLEGKPASRSTPFGRSIQELAERLLGKESAAKKRTPGLGRFFLRT